MNPSTYFSLLAEFGTAHIPVVTLAKKYFNYDEKKAKTEALKNNYPFPVFRLGTQKSVWMADAAEVAKYIDEAKARAKKDYDACKI